MMKKYLIILTILFTGMLFGFQSIAQAGGNEGSVNNYIVLISNTEQLKPIFITAQKLAAEDGKKSGAFQVVVCGKTVENLADEEKMKAIVEMAEKSNVKLIACGFSLNRFNVHAASIPQQFTIVENGILYNFQLQKQGYFSISL